MFEGNQEVSFREVPAPGLSHSRIEMGEKETETERLTVLVLAQTVLTLLLSLIAVKKESLQVLPPISLSLTHLPC